MQPLANLLRLARFGLAPTAAADALVIYFLTHADAFGSAGEGLPAVDWSQVARLAGVSLGLYGFGMVQNDLVDRARDAATGRDRPLVSDEVSVGTAMFTAAVCAGVALVCALSLGTWTASAAAVVFGLINLYHLTTKTMGGVGLLNLGLIRLANAMLWSAEPGLGWPPFLLLAYVCAFALIAYRLEGKTPELGRRDGAVMAIACLAAAAGAALWRDHPELALSNAPDLWAAAVQLDRDGPRTLGPTLETPAVYLSACVFVLLVYRLGSIARREDLPAPARGGLVIKNGMLGLFALDASMLVCDRAGGAALVLALAALSWGLMNVLRKPPHRRKD